MKSTESNNIAEFMDAVYNETSSKSQRAGWCFKTQPTPYYKPESIHISLNYSTDWNWIHPVYRKISEIGLWMCCNGHGMLWIKKHEEIMQRMLNEETPQKAAQKISELIEWYNQQNP